MTKVCVAMATLVLTASLVQAEDKKETKKVENVLGYKMKGLDGKEVDLSAYKGKVVLFVNVASKCGLTPQYEGLQALYEKYGKEGFVVVGVPCNQFGGQEPGSDKQISEFCTTKYKVTFPMLSKVDVNGGSACELYKTLKEKKAGDIKWNFTKFLVGKNGEVVERFEPRTPPEQLTEKIEEELKK